MWGSSDLPSNENKPGEHDHLDQEDEGKPGSIIAAHPHHKQRDRQIGHQEQRVKKFLFEGPYWMVKAGAIDQRPFRRFCLSKPSDIPGAGQRRCRWRRAGQRAGQRRWRWRRNGPTPLGWPETCI